MFSMSLKSVPGTLVSIAPSRIGVPVALTPGLLPQAEVGSALAAELDVAAEALVEATALEDGAEALLELEPEELELQAARTPSDSSAAAAAAVRVRQWTGIFMCSAFCWLTARDYPSERVRAPPRGSASPPG